MYDDYDPWEDDDYDPWEDDDYDDAYDDAWMLWDEAMDLARDALGSMADDEVLLQETAEQLLDQMRGKP